METRYEELKHLLVERRREIESVVREQLSAVREERAAADHVRAFDDGEVSDVDFQQDLELAFVQMKLETSDKLTPRSPAWMPVATAAVPTVVTRLGPRA
jgi:hypothetical protein